MNPAATAPTAVIGCSSLSAPCRISRSEQLRQALDQLVDLDFLEEARMVRVEAVKGRGLPRLHLEMEGRSRQGWEIEGIALGLGSRGEIASG